MRKTSFLRPLTKKIFCAALGCLFLIGVADAMQGADYTIAERAIVDLTPGSGPWSGGNTVTILGTNFCTVSDVTAVTLCGVEATVVSATPTQVVVTAGAGSAVGTNGNVVVMSETLGATVYSNAYTYNPAGRIGGPLGSIAAGRWHSLALKPNGSILTWGNNGHNQLIGTPTGTDFVAITGGDFHSLALKSDGSIVGWGRSDQGRTTVPEPNNGFTAVAAGELHSLGLKSDGSLVSWGGGYDGQVTNTPTETGFIAIACGVKHSLALKSDGSVVAWGNNEAGQTNVPAPNNGFTAVAAGNTHSLGLKEDGSIVSWGDDADGKVAGTPTGTDFVAIVAGYQHSLALRQDGSIANWGKDDQNQRRDTPSEKGFVGIAAGTHSLALKPDGSIVSWGPASEGQMTNAPSGPILAGFSGVSPSLGSWGGGSTITISGTNLCNGTDVTSVTLCGVPATIISQSATQIVVTAGTSASAGVGDVVVTSTSYGTTTKTDAFTYFSISMASGAYNGGNTITITNGHFGTISQVWVGGVAATLIGHGENWVTIMLPVTDVAGVKDIIVQTSDNGNITLPNAYTYNPAGQIGYAHGKIAAGGSHSLGLKVDGSIVSWGNNFYQQVATSPKGSNFVAIAGGGQHALGIKSDGSIMSWGCDVYRQLRETPKGTNFVAIAGGDWHSLALKSDGSIVSWGNWADNYGEVSGTPTNGHFVAIAGGRNHSLALKVDGSIVSWGNNASNQVTTTPTGTNFIAIAGGKYHSLALKSDGSIVGWGDDSCGQVRKIPAGTNFIAVASGWYYALALKSDGSIVSWGDNAQRQVTSTPSGTDFVAIDAGEAHSVALKRDGSIVCWGWDSVNQVKHTPLGTILAGPDGVNPARGALAGNSQVTIFGYNLGDGFDVTNVTLCGVAAAINSQSATQIVVTAGASTRAGVGGVRVFSTSFGETVKSNAYTYLGVGIAVDGSDFGAIPFGTVVTNIFTVTNAGDEALVFTAATTDGDGSAHFDVSALAALTIEAGTAIDFPVIFTANAVGSFTPLCYTVNNSPTPNYSFALQASVYQMSSNVGPAAGGNAITLSLANSGMDITTVTIGGVSATVTGQGADWVEFTVPAGTPGIKDIVIQSTSVGTLTLGGAYTVNPAGIICSTPPALDLAAMTGTNGFVINGIAEDDLSGYSVSGAGDLNGDGFDDLLISAPNANSFAGASYVVYGSPNGFSAALDLAALNGTNGFVINGIAEEGLLGVSVSGAGDLNGDGFDDLLIGAPYANSYAGASYVVYGSANRISAAFDLASLNGTNGFVINGVAEDDRFGHSVSGAGDVNGDGLADLLIGAISVNSNAGASYVVYGSPNGVSPTFDLASLNGTNGFVINGIAEGDVSGVSVSGAGDVNGDGFDDLFIGAPYANSEAGASYVVYGSATRGSAALDLASLNGTNGFIIDGIAAYDNAGYSVSGAGDVNGDGLDDLLIGAPGANSGAGASYVVYGSVNRGSAALDLASLNGTNGFVINGVAEGDFFGYSVSGAGDVNGDGFDDLLIGAPALYSGANASYVVYGSATRGAALDLASLNDTDGFVITGIDEDGYFGYSVSRAGDVNGDGLDDLLIGAFGTNLGTGASYLVYGVRAESGVSTSSGSIAGGYEVTISGVNLGNGTDVTNVTLCGISATIISQSSTEIVVRVAAGTPGIGDVVVFSTSFGETVKENAFEYVRVEPFTITSFVPQGTGFLLQFNAIVGQYYAIEYTDNFPTGLWNEVRLPQPATKNQMQWLDTDPAANNRLYRVKQVAP